MLLVLFFTSGCSSSRFVPDGDTQLSSVRITSDDKQVKPGSFRTYVRQEPNSRWFNLVKVPLGLYCLSGSDSTKAFNRFIHRIGEAPVIYDSALTELSRNNLTQALQGKGYLHATVEADTTCRKRKTHVTYRLHPGQRSYINRVDYRFDDPDMRREVLSDIAKSPLRKGTPLDASVLNDERNRIVSQLRNRGYYYINKEFVSFRADTARNDLGADVTMFFARPAGIDSSRVYRAQRLRNVAIYEDANPGEAADTTTYRGLHICYNGHRKILRRIYNAHTHIRPGNLYRDMDIRDTYRGLNGLQAVNYSAIRFREAGDSLLDCDISIRNNRPHTIGAEIEGTNTSGNLGAALVLTYDNRNLFRGSENLSLKIRGAYEAITGLEGYNNQNYIEYSMEAGLKFPTFLIPFLSQRRKQSMKATSEVSLMYDSQNRPEFHRRVLTGSWTYRWSPNKAQGRSHRLDLLSLNYIFMPWISGTFRQEYLENDDPRYAVLRSSYENLFIMKFGYSFTYNSIAGKNVMGLYQTNGYQVRLAAESAGNLLQGISKMLHRQRNKDGQYTLFNIAYSQYVKFDFDFAKSFLINDRNSLAVHTALGIALPYGNSNIIPYEKRYFAGGANSVRGWSVRELGPGSYSGRDGKIDFINQTGNLKLDFSLEYRTRLFWKFHGAAFIDAGNIWNTRNYADQEGGQFHFNKFYKQIAAAYGLGIRFNLDYFILRFDGGMKAINPATESGPGHWPLLHPRFSRDFTFHFAVGLPF